MKAIKRFCYQHIFPLAISLGLIFLSLAIMQETSLYNIKNLLVLVFVTNLSSLLFLQNIPAYSLVYLVISSIFFALLVLVDSKIMLFTEENLEYIKIFSMAIIFATGPFAFVREKHIDDKLSIAGIWLPYIFAYIIVTSTSYNEVIYSYSSLNAIFALFYVAKHGQGLSQYIAAQAFSCFFMLYSIDNELSEDKISIILAIFAAINIIYAKLMISIKKENVRQILSYIVSIAPILWDQGVFAYAASFYLLFIVLLSQKLHSIIAKIDINLEFMKEYLHEFSSYEFRVLKIGKAPRIEINLPLTICCIFIILSLFTVI